METKEAFKFAEWLGQHFVRLHMVWVHKYHDQRDRNNYRTTEELYERWLDNKKIDRNFRSSIMK